MVLEPGSVREECEAAEGSGKECVSGEGCLSLGEGARQRSLVVLESAVQHQGALERSVCPRRVA